MRVSSDIGRAVSGISARRALIVLFLVALAAAFFALRDLSGADAQGLVEVCAPEQDKEKCYEREVPKLLSQMPLKDVFDVIREIRRLDPGYQFCHVLAHKLGEIIVAEDPERWIEAMPHNPPDGLCSNGFIHGVVGGRFRAEVLDEPTIDSLIPDFFAACSPRPGWTPSDLDRAICVHGMGHLYTFITDANLPLALSVCERSAEEGMARMCREGVFMQIYQPLEPDDFLLIERMPVKPTRETVRAFCARYERDEYEGACLRESWPFFREEVKTGAGIEEFCAGQPNREETRACFESSFALLGRMSLAEPEQALQACATVSEEWKSDCYAYAARTIVEEDRAAGGKVVAFCERAEGYERDCLRSVAEKSYFLFGDSPYRDRFCTALSEDFRTACAR